MGTKMLYYTAILACIIFVVEIDCSFIKGKNVPRVGRSNEADGYYDHEMGYVIKTIPNKNIPRMGRRNYDSVSIFSSINFQNKGIVVYHRFLEAIHIFELPVTLLWIKLKACFSLTKIIYLHCKSIILTHSI